MIFHFSLRAETLINGFRLRSMPSVPEMNIYINLHKIETFQLELSQSKWHYSALPVQNVITIQIVGVLKIDGITRPTDQLPGGGLWRLTTCGSAGYDTGIFHRSRNAFQAHKQKREKWTIALKIERAEAVKSSGPLSRGEMSSIFLIPSWKYFNFFVSLQFY